MRKYPPVGDLLRIDLTAMIDVIFLLLIFWMTVARLAGSSAAAELDTPETDALKVIEIPPGLVTVEWRAEEDHLFVSGRPVTHDELITVLSETPQTHHVLLRVEGAVEAARVQELLGRLGDLGIDRVGVAVRTVER